MFCPHTIVFNRRWLMIIRHEETDYISRHRVPWRERINPLRYEICFRPGTPRNWSINKGGAAERALSNFLYRMRRAR